MKVSLFKPKTHLGIAAGFVAGAISLPFMASKASPQEVLQPTATTTKNEKADNKSVEEIISLLKELKPMKDNRLEETRSVEITWSTAREAALALYKAEAEDVKLLREGKITEKDRKVKIFFSDFVPPYEEGEDEGPGPSLHVVKKYVGDHGETYVIEDWPVNEKTGDILLPDGIRISTQILNEKDRSYFVTNMFQVVWGVNYGGTGRGGWELPFFYRQHLYGDFNGRGNPIIQARPLISNSHNSCVSCHCHMQRTNPDDIRFFGKQTNFVSDTKPEAFNKPYPAQVGYLKLIAYLQNKVEKGKLTQKQVSAIAEGLLDSTRMRVPSMIEALEDHKTIPWIEEDTLVKNGELVPEGFYYKEKEDDKEVWKRAALEYFESNGALQGVGKWWNLTDLKVIP